MSDIENRKVQDVLREVAEINYKLGVDSDTIIGDLCTALGINFYGNGPALQRALNEIADRIDRQSVVEVKVPPKLEPSSDRLVPAELEAMTPAIIDVHDCIIDVHIHGGIDVSDS